MATKIADLKKEIEDLKNQVSELGEHLNKEINEIKSNQEKFIQDIFPLNKIANKWFLLVILGILFLLIIQALFPINSSLLRQSNYASFNTAIFWSDVLILITRGIVFLGIIFVGIKIIFTED